MKFIKSESAEKYLDEQVEFFYTIPNIIEESIEPQLSPKYPPIISYVIGLL